MILTALPYLDLLHASQVCWCWRNLFLNVVDLQHNLFKKAVNVLYLFKFVEVRKFSGLSCLHSPLDLQLRLKLLNARKPQKCLMR